MKFVLGRVKNIVRKGENAVYQHFLFLPQYFLLYQRQKQSFNPFLNNKFLDSSKLELADQNVKFV